MTRPLKDHELKHARPMRAMVDVRLFSSQEMVALDGELCSLAQLARDGRVYLRVVPASAVPPYDKRATELVDVAQIVNDSRGWPVSAQTADLLRLAGASDGH